MEYRPWICSCSFASCHSILTSGIILITAGYIIGQKCSVFYIADIGALLARDASIAVPLVLILLPALLALGDKWIIDRRLKGYDLYPESVPKGDIVPPLTAALEKWTETDDTVWREGKK